MERNGRGESRPLKLSMVSCSALTRAEEGNERARLFMFNDESMSPQQLFGYNGVRREARRLRERVDGEWMAVVWLGVRSRELCPFDSAAQ